MVNFKCDYCKALVQLENCHRVHVKDAPHFVCSKECGHKLENEYKVFKALKALEAKKVD